MPTGSRWAGTDVYDHPIHQLIRRTCTVHHSDPGVVDEYGDHPVTVIDSTTERCYLTQSRRAEEDTIEVERWNLYFLPSTAIDANDAVDVDGISLQVYGEPWIVSDPVTGWPTHIEATAVRRR